MSDVHGFVSEAQDLVKELVYDNGVQVRIRYFTGSDATTDYDNTTSLAISGDDYWTSGVCVPVAMDSKSAIIGNLLEQGKILYNDRILYVKGDVDTSNTMKIGLGSPVSEENSVIVPGVIGVPAYGMPAYKKIYMRLLPTGSLTGE